MTWIDSVCNKSHFIELTEQTTAWKKKKKSLLNHTTYGTMWLCDLGSKYSFPSSNEQISCDEYWGSYYSYQLNAKPLGLLLLTHFRLRSLSHNELCIVELQEGRSLPQHELPEGTIRDVTMCSLGLCSRKGAVDNSVRISLFCWLNSATDS